MYHLQFVDDTILFSDGSWSNLWTIKALMRGFEMVSGLSINFHKSKLYGVGNSTACLEASVSFLGCKTDMLPFKFLGCLVGGNHRSIAFWNPIARSLEARWSSWKGRMLSIGGTATLINSVLSNMTSYQFSFYKAPIKVLKKIEAI